VCGSVTRVGLCVQCWTAKEVGRLWWHHVVVLCNSGVRPRGGGSSDCTAMAFCMVVLCDSIMQVVLWWRRGETLGVGWWWPPVGGGCTKSWAVALTVRDDAKCDWRSIDRTKVTGAVEGRVWMHKAGIYVWGVGGRRRVFWAII